MNTEQKYCNKCGKWKDLSCFWLLKTGRRAGTYYPVCKECKRAAYREWRENHPLPPKPEDIFCPGCEEILPISDFKFDRSYASGYATYCRSCVASGRRKYRAENVDHRKLELEQDKFSLIKRKYGLSKEEYLYLMETTTECPICRLPMEQHEKVLDHDHVTGKFRSILCYRCNLFIGNARESVEVLQGAIDYLNKFKNDLVLSSNGTSNE